MGHDYNRRLYHRVKMSLSTQGQNIEERKGRIRFTAQTRDLSPRGLGLLVTDPDQFKAGQSVKISVTWGEDEKPIQVLGLVRWIGDLKGETLNPAVGVELTGMASVRDYDRWLRMLHRECS